MKCSKCEKQGFSVDELLPHGICAECKTVCPHCLHGFRRDTGPTVKMKNVLLVTQRGLYND